MGRQVYKTMIVDPFTLYSCGCPRPASAPRPGMLSVGQSISSWYGKYHGKGEDIRLDMVPVFILDDHITCTVHNKRARWWRGRASTEVFHELLVRHKATAIVDLSACRLGQL